MRTITLSHDRPRVVYATSLCWEHAIPKRMHIHLRCGCRSARSTGLHAEAHPPAQRLGQQHHMRRFWPIYRTHHHQRHRKNHSGGTSSNHSSIKSQYIPRYASSIWPSLPFRGYRLQNQESDYNQTWAHVSELQSADTRTDLCRGRKA